MRAPLGQRLAMINQAAINERLRPPQIVQAQKAQRYPNATGSTVRMAFCKTAAGAAQYLTCYLDTDITGEEVTVIFVICNGTALNAALPRLALGQMIFVAQFSGVWLCVGTPFQASVNCACS